MTPGMETIREMIETEVKLHSTSSYIRLHALLDCYAALGGDVSLWRREDGRLK